MKRCTTSKRWMFVCALLGSICSISAQAVEYDLGLALIYAQTSSNVSPAPAGLTYSSIGGVGFGLSSVFMLSANLAVELDLLYDPYGTSVNTALLGIPVNVESIWHVVQMPVLLRYSFLPMVSLGAGFCYGRALGNAGVDTTVGTGGTPTHSEVELSSKSDFGLALAAGGKVPVVEGFSFFGDLRYLRGLKNGAANTATETSKLNQLQVLLGVSMDVIN